MRIKRHAHSVEREREIEAELAEAVWSKGVEGRVCGAHCDAHCRQCGSTRCQCQCSPFCRDAPQMLSSDPKEHPLETRIAPLVYEMKRLGMFDACWSCEGHLDPDGQLMKTPTVWFYCDKMAHVRVLASGLAKLKYAKRLRAEWRIAVTFSDTDNPDVTFALEPSLSQAESLTLAELQSDIDEITRSLQGIMIDEARALMNAPAA